jgi:hypothetical protein
MKKTILALLVLVTLSAHAQTDTTKPKVYYLANTLEGYQKLVNTLGKLKTIQQVTNAASSETKEVDDLILWVQTQVSAQLKKEETKPIKK